MGLRSWRQEKTFVSKATLSQGIGAALVQHARTAGHQVVFTGRNDAHIQSTAKETGAHGIKANVASDADNARAVDEAVKKMGGIDVLINNAGFGYNAEIGALDIDAMRTLFATNVFGMVDITNRVVPMMKAQGDGDIVNIASTSGTRAPRAARSTPAASGRCAASASAGRRSCGRSGSG